MLSIVHIAIPGALWSPLLTPLATAGASCTPLGGLDCFCVGRGLKAPRGRRLLLAGASSYTFPSRVCDLPAAEALALTLEGGAMSTPARRRLIRDFKKLQQVGFVGVLVLALFRLCMLADSAHVCYLFLH